MICERVRPYLTAHTAGESAVHTAAWVQAHLDGCAECRAVAGRHTAVTSALRAVAPDDIQPPAGFTDAVMARVYERESYAGRRVLPLPLLPPGDLARIPGEIARAVQDNREAILSAAGTAAMAAATAWLAWRAVRSVRSRPRRAAPLLRAQPHQA